MSNSDNNSLWAKFRMPSWEEDISLNHKSLAPFVNLPAPSEIPREKYNVMSQLKPALLDGRPLEEFIARDSYPMPAEDDREGYNAGLNAHYFLNGLADTLKILSAARRHNVEVRSYLDFGCASGRVLRHFCCQTEIPELWGSDINGRHIRWLNEHLPSRLKIVHNHCLPSLPIADNSLDVISAFSVFTHIDIFETAWLAELYRILRPGGLVYLTVQNDASWEKMRAEGANQMLVARLLARNPDFLEQLALDLPNYRLDYRHTNLGPYRAVVFHSDQYLQQTWGRFFKVEEIVPLDHGLHQSVFIGRKV